MEQNEYEWLAGKAREMEWNWNEMWMENFAIPAFPFLHHHPHLLVSKHEWLDPCWQGMGWDGFSCQPPSTRVDEWNQSHMRTTTDVAQVRIQ